MPKIAIIVYHKNVEKIYPKEWIDTFRKSILSQTYKDFDILELEYGGGGFKIFNSSYYESFPMKNFVYAMNYLLDRCCSIGYDAVANVNVDDYYSIDRFEKQLPFIEQGFDIVSSNFSLVKNDEIVLTHRFHELDIKEELSKRHNPLCHPVIMYSKLFIENNRYSPDSIPFEDMLLWTDAINNGYKFKILEDVLCYHRLHDNSVGHKLKEE